MNVQDHPHRRLNALTGDWILVSPHRTQRPWQGKRESVAADNYPPYDPTCYLCPGNARAAGVQNPKYTETFVFTNDFPALLPEFAPAGASGLAQEDSPTQGLLRRENVAGTCRVICFSPRHDLTLPKMPLADIRKVIDVWSEQIEELGKTYRWVQVFENKGEVMGCSNPHPHGQIWASNQLPNEPAKEDQQQRDYLQRHGTKLLLDYLQLEQEQQQRIVVENEHWVAVVPYWATWPFETLLLPRQAVLRLPDLNAVQRAALADALKRLLSKYDQLFETSFPYSMGWHGAPTAAGDWFHWQLHAHFYPPLLRSATVKKFMVGYEMLAEAQRDLTPEQAAQRLRELSESKEG
ncbi:MAG TPA: UDP-glucose--hexose-1-phosphate uridylyltransferase [Pirellulales bacterium]|jgi:UDPglucose--hexose-1-phosphate uridylyltransferase|nr:UDP-glucose--hexose-1-phosphate uridylyltransferase [Pirellulales bacterium]